jgi:hypothetical protein
MNLSSLKGFRQDSYCPTELSNHRLSLMTRIRSWKYSGYIRHSFELYFFPVCKLGLLGQKIRGSIKNGLPEEVGTDAPSWLRRLPGCSASLLKVPDAKKVLNVLKN